MLLTIRNLEVNYGNQTALLIDSPLFFEEGERVGIIGSNGAGKSTFVKSVLSLVSYKGHIDTQLTPEEMAVHMQFNRYATTMPVKIIMETVLDTSLKENRKLQELISFFEFENCLKKKFNMLSGGQKQKMTIIMVMMQNAKLTFYDEVTSGLDFETRQKLMEKLVEWYRGKNDTLMVVSHYYEELEQLADKILLLDEGRVIAYGTKEELFSKYCGSSVVILENTGKNRDLSKDFCAVKSPQHLIALSCKNEEDERRILSILIRNNVNFKRSNSDIEIMSINAREDYYEKIGGMR